MSGEDQDRQQQLFSTLVRWTNGLLVLSAVINIYWLPIDFWRTLLQEVIALAVVGIGLWCLRLTRQGQTSRAIQLYVSTAMVLMTTAILVLGPQSILNGALGMALFVLIASHFDSQDRALRWGLVGIVLYVSALSLRVLGPFGETAFAASDLVALYIFPVAALLAFSLLGRNATARLNEALTRSEVDRHELKHSNQALKQARTALEIANAHLQSELEERKRVESALRDSLEQTARSQQLLLALSKAAQAVQQARTPEEVYRTVGDEVRTLGRSAFIARLNEDGTHLALVYLTFDPDVVKQVERLVGFPLDGYSWPVVKGIVSEQALTNVETIAVKLTSESAAWALPTEVQPQADEVLALLGMDEAILAPLTATDEALGVLVVSGSGAGQDEVQAVSCFASQAAIALSNVRLYQETLAGAADLERRVEERTAQLAASEACYKRLFESNRDGLCVLDMQGRILETNPALCQLLAYASEELQALDVFQVGGQLRGLSSEERAQLLRGFQTELHGARRTETDLIRKDRERVPVEMTVTPLTFQRREAALVSVRDVTERRQAEAELRRLFEEQRTSHSRLQHLARQVVLAQENERKRLSHALHDEAGQALTALKINLELIAQDLPRHLDSVRERLANTVVMTESTMDEIRQLAQDLRPPALDTLGLNAALAGFCHDFARRTQLAIDYRGAELSAQPEPVSITLYRFLQEGLTNVARHAAAEQVHVALDHDAETIRLSVRDDGQGFDAKTLLSASGSGLGMGLAGMWERVDALDGRLEIDSRPGQGTHLSATIPLLDEHAEV